MEIMRKNVKVSGALIMMVAIVFAASQLPQLTMAVPLELDIRPEAINANNNPNLNEARLRLANMIIERIAALNNKRLGCIPQYNRCGPAMDGVHCCEPYTCTSQYYGRCA